MSANKFLPVIALSLGLVAASAHAATHTGQVGYYFTQDYAGGPVYTFVNIGPGTAICYYIGQNTAYASILATNQVGGSPVTVSCDSTGKITQMAN